MASLSLGENSAMANAPTNAEGKRTHRATYARDKKTGGWLVRVVGPQAAEFAGDTVPVSTANGEEHDETLTIMRWSGPDKDPSSGELTGRNAALYSFDAKPRTVTKPTF
jgi:hypothetical protein